MKFFKKILALGLSGCMLLGFAACGGEQPSEMTQAGADEQAATTVKKIGVAVYSIDDDEVNMFRTYYENYLENAFEVEFIYSSAISTLEDEKAFVDAAKEEGCEGIISFITNDLPAIVEYCGDDIYYTMGSGTVSQEDYDAVKNNDHFIGITGPSPEDEYNAGVDMIRFFAGENGGSKNYLVLNGGTGYNNYMHQQRFQGMIDTLESEVGFTFNSSFEEMSALTETTMVAESKDGGKVYVAPGYFYSEEGYQFMEKALTLDEFDVMATVCSVTVLSDKIAAREAEQGKDIQVGTVSCFSEDNHVAFMTEDEFGNSSLNYLAGKCEAMSAPAFIAMYNAVTGHPEVFRKDNQAYWLNQGFWVADNAEEFDELASEAHNVYQNSYGTSEMMENITIFNEGANYGGFKKFVESLV